MVLGRVSVSGGMGRVFSTSQSVVLTPCHPLLTPQQRRAPRAAGGRAPATFTPVLQIDCCHLHQHRWYSEDPVFQKRKKARIPGRGYGPMMRQMRAVTSTWDSAAEARGYRSYHCYHTAAGLVVGVPAVGDGEAGARPGRIGAESSSRRTT